MLLDVMMPQGGIDGFEVCEKLKSDPDTAGIHIVMLTAIQQEVDIQKGRDAGADDYFTKPFSPLKLLEKVEEILGRGEDVFLCHHLLSRNSIFPRYFGNKDLYSRQV